MIFAMSITSYAQTPDTMAGNAMPKDDMKHHDSMSKDKMMDDKMAKDDMKHHDAMGKDKKNEHVKKGHKDKK